MAWDAVEIGVAFEDFEVGAADAGVVDLEEEFVGRGFGVRVVGLEFELALGRADECEHKVSWCKKKELRY